MFQIQGTSTTNRKTIPWAKTIQQLFYNKQHSDSIRRVHVNDMSYIQLVSNNCLFRGILLLLLLLLVVVVVVVVVVSSNLHISASLSAQRPITKQKNYNTNYTKKHTQTHQSTNRFMT